MAVVHHPEKKPENIFMFIYNALELWINSGSLEHILCHSCNQMKKMQATYSYYKIAT